MKNKQSKTEVEKQIKEFFSSIENKSPSEIKKIKTLAMSRNVKLGENKRLFCKKCLVPYGKPKIRIKNKMKIVICENCGNISRWKL